MFWHWHHFLFCQNTRKKTMVPDTINFNLEVAKWLHSQIEGQRKISLPLKNYLVGCMSYIFFCVTNFLFEKFNGASEVIEQCYWEHPKVCVNLQTDVR